jgi:hypothetical protein
MEKNEEGQGGIDREEWEIDWGGGNGRCEKDLKSRKETRREESELRGKGVVREGGKIMRVGKEERRAGIIVMGKNEEGQGGIER